MNGVKRNSKNPKEELRTNRLPYLSARKGMFYIMNYEGREYRTDGIQVSDDSTPASENIRGNYRYRETANSSSVDMCMKTGTSSYEWVNIQTINW